jgi:hypothetical protein
MFEKILKSDHPRTIPTKFGLIWFCSFRRKDLNVKIYDVRGMGGRTDYDGCQVMTKAHMAFEQVS